MIKNIVFDIGGVILDISDDVVIKFLNKKPEEVKKITKIIYKDKRWNECLLGNITQQEYMKDLILEFPEYKIEIETILGIKYQENVLPIIKETLNIMYKLKEKNYKIYFLSNFTEASYYYMKDKLKIIDDFDGGIFSWKEHLIKPNEAIYELLINRYNLNKEETIFFDDTLKNIEVANKLGIKSVQIKEKDSIVNTILSSIKDENSK